MIISDTFFIVVAWAFVLLIVNLRGAISVRGSLKKFIGEDSYNPMGKGSMQIHDNFVRDKYFLCSMEKNTE